MQRLFLVALIAVTGQTFAESVIDGSYSAPITIEEYSDFYCPYCAKGAKTMEKIVKHYFKDVKLVFRNMPLDFHNPGATTAAKAFVAVYLQRPSLAYAFQKKIFANQDKLSQIGEEYLFDVALALGADMAKLRADMDGAEVAKILSDDSAAAKLHRFSGTPSFVIDGEEITGARPYDEFKKIIEKHGGGC